jgi:hypothetical protein
MSEEKVLRKEIAEQFLADDESVDLSEFTMVEFEAVEILCKHKVDLTSSSLSFQLSNRHRHR